MKKYERSTKKKRSGLSQRFSTDQIKQVKVSMENDEIKQEGIRKTNSFLLSGDRIIDYMNIEIGKDYINCLERINGKRQKN